MTSKELNDRINDTSLMLADAEQELASLMRELGLDSDNPVRKEVFGIRKQILDIIDELEYLKEDLGNPDTPEPPETPKLPEDSGIRNIEFVSYDGKWPCLCGGKLTLKVDGVEQTFEYCLCSGGICMCGLNDDDSVVTEGDWTLTKDKFSGFSDEELKVIAKLVNDNVPHGCCGGCL